MAKILDLPLPIGRRRAPRMSPAGFRLVLWLAAGVLAWAGIVALVDGLNDAGLLAILVSRVFEWVASESRHQ